MANSAAFCGGSYDGDALLDMMVANYSIEAIAAFEPDEATYAKLSEFVRATKSELPATIFVIPI